MRWMARRARSTSRRARVLTVLTVLATAVAYCAALVLPSDVGAAATIHAAGRPTPSQPLTISSTSQAFDGVPVVGALFTSSGGKLGTHFCTASVVHSTHGDLAITAAHCVAGIQGQVVFVPGYANGKEPYGVWPVSAIYTDQAWQSDQDQMRQRWISRRDGLRRAKGSHSGSVEFRRGNPRRTSPASRRRAPERASLRQ